MLNSWLRLSTDIIKTNFELLQQPYRYFLVVTKSCQSRCKHCNIWQEQPQNELSINEFNQLAKNSSHLKWLNISGGEPTDREDLVEIIEGFKRHCPDLLLVNFTTNGLVPEKIYKIATELAELKIYKLVINVSIDGPPVINDKLRGVQGNFDLSIESFRLLQSIKNIESKISMTLFESNRLLIQETITAIQQRIPSFGKTQLHLNIPHESSHYYKNTNRPPQANSELISIIRQFQESKSIQLDPISIIETIYRRKSQEYLQTYKTPLQCSAIMSSVYISEKGIVYPCTIWDKPIGSLRENNFDVSALLKSETAKRLRQQVRNKECTQCWTPCEAYPTILANLQALIP
jgi:MoaA/NifB/PqqE/SkfB family radical SAM enzyme